MALIFKISLLVILWVGVVQASPMGIEIPKYPTPIDQTSSKQDSSDSQAKSRGNSMVDFIRKLLGDQPKPIQEELIRDEE